jgi:hypothetical protein
VNKRKRALLDPESRDRLLSEVTQRPDDGWSEVSTALTGTWRRNPNRGLRILRDYVGNGSSSTRVDRVLAYLSSEAFLLAEIGNEETDALRKFCERKHRQRGAA